MGDDELPESITIHAIAHPGVTVDPWTGTINANGQNGSIGAIGSVVGINTTSHWNGSNITNSGVSIAEHTIQGQLIYEELRVDHTLVEDAHGDEFQFKERLMEKLIRALFKSNCIEFTKAESIHTGEVVFRARIFVVPDTKVRILRESKVI